MAALPVEQINGTAFAARGLDEFFQNLREHGFDPGLGAQHPADLEQGFHRPRDLVHHAVERFDFAQHRGGPFLAAAEVEARHAQRLRRDAFQGAPHGAAGLPAERQEQHDQTDRYQDHARAIERQHTQQFVDGSSTQEPHGHAVDAIERQGHPDPFPPAGFVGNDLAVGRGNLPQARECADAQGLQRADIGRAQCPPVLQQRIHVAVGDHRAVLVHQGQLGVGRHAQAAQRLAQVFQRHIDCRDGPPRVGQAGKRDAHLPCREEDVRPGSDRGYRVHRTDVPGPLARIELVIGLRPAQHELVPGVVEEEQPMALAIIPERDRLHEIVGLGRRLELLAHIAPVQRTHEQEIAVLIPHVDGRHQRVLGQLGRQHTAPRQAVVEPFRIDDWVERQHAQRYGAGLDDAARAFGHDLPRVARRHRGHVQQDGARPIPAERDQGHGHDRHGRHRNAGDDEPDRPCAHRTRGLWHGFLHWFARKNRANPPRTGRACLPETLRREKAILSECH